MSPAAGPRRGARWAVVSCLVLVVGCGGPAGPPGREGSDGAGKTFVVDLTVAGEPGEPVSELVNRGTGGARAELVVTGGAGAHVEAAPIGPALRLPEYAGGEPRFAVVRVQAEGEDTSLDPGSRDFVLGVDLRLDEVSSGAPADNGDNVVQRGLFEGGQYKIQIDHRVPSCRLAGSAGALVVTGEALAADRWYRVECERQGEQVQLSVVPLSGEGAGRAQLSSASGPVGSIDIAPGVPLSVGGKLAADGEIVVASSDQFNGSVARVRLGYLS